MLTVFIVTDLSLKYEAPTCLQPCPILPLCKTVNEGTRRTEHSFLLVHVPTHGKA